MLLKYNKKKILFDINFQPPPPQYKYGHCLILLFNLLQDYLYRKRFIAIILCICQYINIWEEPIMYVSRLWLYYQLDITFHVSIDSIPFSLWIIKHFALIISAGVKSCILRLLGNAARQFNCFQIVRLIIKYVYYYFISTSVLREIIKQNKNAPPLII